MAKAKKIAGDDKNKLDAIVEDIKSRSVFQWKSQAAARVVDGELTDIDMAEAKKIAGDDKARLNAIVEDIKSRALHQDEFGWKSQAAARMMNGQLSETDKVRATKIAEEGDTTYEAIVKDIKARALNQLMVTAAHQRDDDMDDDEVNEDNKIRIMEYVNGDMAEYLAVLESIKNIRINIDKYQISRKKKANDRLEITSGSDHILCKCPKHGGSIKISQTITRERLQYYRDSLEQKVTSESTYEIYNNEEDANDDNKEPRASTKPKDNQKEEIINQLIRLAKADGMRSNVYVSVKNIVNFITEKKNRTVTVYELRDATLKGNRTTARANVKSTKTYYIKKKELPERIYVLPFCGSRSAKGQNGCRQNLTPKDGKTFGTIALSTIREYDLELRKKKNKKKDKKKAKKKDKKKGQKKLKDMNVPKGHCIRCLQHKGGSSSPYCKECQTMCNRRPGQGPGEWCMNKKSLPRSKPERCHQCPKIAP